MTDEDMNGKPKRAGDRDKAQVGVLPVDQELFDWLEQLFYAEPEVAHFPEKIDIHVMQGANKRTFGDCLKMILFAPKKAVSKKAAEEAGVSYLGESKPSREKLITLTNQFTHYMRRDCDASGKPQKYLICAWHSSFTDGAYDQLPRILKPRGIYGKTGDGFGDEDEMPIEKRFGVQILEHQRQMFGLYGSGMEGMIDRLDRSHERDAAEIEKLRNENQRLREQLDRALSLQIEHDERRQWLTLRNKATDKALTLVESFGTPLVGKLIGKSEVAEVITLKNFLRSTEEGGQLTAQQAVATFGDWDNETNTLRSAGILTRPQGEIIFRVAFSQIHVDELDKLLPGGELEITGEQFAKLQQIFSLEQLGGIGILIKDRMQKKASQKEKA